MQIYFTAIIKESDSFRQKKRHVQKARIFSKTFRFIERNSHQRCSMKKGVLRNFTKFTGKHLCQSLFFNKVADLRLATFLKKRLWHRCFPVIFAKFLRTPFLQNTSGRLLFTNDEFKNNCSHIYSDELELN